MTIDWLNPSDDVLEAKQVGYNAGLAERNSELEAAQAETDDLRRQLEEAKTENENLRAANTVVGTCPKHGPQALVCCSVCMVDQAAELTKAQIELEETRAIIEAAKAEIAELRDCVDRQRDCFLKWSDLVKAVTTAANIQTCPPISHVKRRWEEWETALNDDERKCLSAVLDIAAGVRSGNEDSLPPAEAAEAAKEKP